MGATCSRTKEPIGDTSSLKHASETQRSLARTRSDLETDGSVSSFQEEIRSIPTTTYIPAIFMQDSKMPIFQRPSKTQWFRQMLEMGRLVIEDKQFQGKIFKAQLSFSAGGYVRSVPIIQPSPSQSTILQR